MSYDYKDLKPLNEDIYLNYRQYFDSLKELLSFSKIIIEELNSLKLSQKDIDDFKKLVLFLFFRTTTLGRAIWLLASDGLFIESNIVLRSAIEIYIHAKYIMHHNHSEYCSLSREYFEFLRYKEKKKYYLSLDITKEIGPIEYEEIIRKRINDLNSEFGDKRPTDFWPGRKTNELAKQAGLKRYYETVFDVSSKYSHASLDCLHNYYNPNNKNWSLHTFPKNIDEVLIKFYDIYLYLNQIVEHTFWRNPFKALEIFRRKLRELQELSLSKMDNSQHSSSI